MNDLFWDFFSLSDHNPPTHSECHTRTLFLSWIQTIFLVFGFRSLIYFPKIFVKSGVKKKINIVFFRVTSHSEIRIQDWNKGRCMLYHDFESKEVSRSESTRWICRIMNALVFFQSWSTTETIWMIQNGLNSRIIWKIQNGIHNSLLDSSSWKQSINVMEIDWLSDWDL